MGLTYDWKLTGLKKQNTDTLSDVIVGTRWKITATDENGHSGVFNGATPFEPQDLNGDGFVDYQDLTEELVLEWVKEYVSGSNRSTNYMNHINQQIQKQIDHVKYANLEVSEEDMPWSPTSGSVTSPEPQIAPATPE
jgi:hypothetical protein